MPSCCSSSIRSCANPFWEIGIPSPFKCSFNQPSSASFRSLIHSLKSCYNPPFHIQHPGAEPVAAEKVEEEEEFISCSKWILFIFNPLPISHYREQRNWRNVFPIINRKPINYPSSMRWLLFPGQRDYDVRDLKGYAPERNGRQMLLIKEEMNGMSRLNLSIPLLFCRWIILERRIFLI